MRPEDFNDILRHQINTCDGMLIKKAAEYAPDADRLHNFRQAANLSKETMAQALGGFMLKHTVSIYDMIQSGEHYELDLWSEKITDHINYLLILKAVVVEEELNRNPTLKEI